MRKKIRERLAHLGIGATETETPIPSLQSESAELKTIDIQEIARGEFISFETIASKFECSVRHARRLFEDVPNLVRTGITARSVPWCVWLQFLEASLVVGTKNQKPQKKRKAPGATEGKSTGAVA